MPFTRPALIAACCASGLIAAACASRAPETPHSALAGTAWVAEQLDGRAVTPTALTLRFAEEDRVRGSGGCNTVAGLYEAADGFLDMRALARTERGCAPAIMAQEDAFIALLDAASRYRRDGDRLLITADDGRSASFRAASF